MRMTGSCHCGAVQFDAPTPKKSRVATARIAIEWVRCRRIARLEFVLFSDPAALLEYGPNQGKHFSCSTCGMVTHGRSPNFEKPGGEKMSYNVRMDIEFDRSQVRVVDLDGRHQW